MSSCTYIDGIGSSQALDTSGEIVDLKGLDITSLIGSSFNFEHESKLPSQIVGKILKAHKIFSEKDCQNDRHLFYWKKCQLPFLYIMGRLFDDKKPSSVEVAALFKDDAEHPDEPDMMGFSVEGSKIAKSGAVITHSIARKVTITAMPANKTCIAEMVQPSKKSKKSDDIDELFKGEMELFEFEPSYIEIMTKGENSQKLGPHFLFSAENPMHPHKNELKMNHTQTLGHLKNKGFKADEVKGHYGSPETSIMVHGVSPKQAEHLHGIASKLGQDSSIYSTGTKHEMRFHHGENAGKKVHGEGTVWHKEKPKDMYTTMSNGKHFTHNFDFGKSEDLTKYNNMDQGDSPDKYEGYGISGAGMGGGTGGVGGAFIGSQLAMSEEECSDLEKSAGWSQPHLRVKAASPEGAGLHFEHARHGKLSVTKSPIGNFEVKHNDKLIGVSPHAKEAATHAKKYMSKLGKSEDLKKAGAFATPEAAAIGRAAFGAPSQNAAPPTVPKPPPSPSGGGMFSPAFIQGAKTGGGFVKSEEMDLKKAMTAGSMNAAPGQLEGMAALTPESLERKSKKVNGMSKAEKSKWYSRAEDSYKSWDKKAHFKEYMKKRMPHLAEGEVDAIGRVLALKKTLQAEGKLSKMYASYFDKSEIAKGSDGMMASEDHIHGLPKGHPSLGEHKGHTYRRISPPTKTSNHWTWAIRHPSGAESKFHAPAESAGHRDAVHAHIESLSPKK